MLLLLWLLLQQQLLLLWLLPPLHLSKESKLKVAEREFLTF